MDKLERRRRVISKRIVRRTAIYKGVLDDAGGWHSEAPCVAWNYGKAGLKMVVVPCLSLWTERAYMSYVALVESYVTDVFAKRFRHISYERLCNQDLPRGTDGAFSIPIR